jgi:phosphatidylserine decarboxylase
MIAPEGWPFVLVPLCVAIAAALFSWWVPVLVFAAASVFALYFFRNPARSCDDAEDIACSPADGKIIKIADSPAEIAERGLPRQVSIFMSPFDVHINRAPITGSLVDYSYNPGKKFSAFKEKASLENEQNLSFWRGPAGTIALKQIAGLVARRIVFDLSVGESLGRGDRFGLIRYGSRVDVFLPADAQILVSLNDRVRSGETALARLSGRDPS